MSIRRWVDGTSLGDISRVVEAGVIENQQLAVSTYPGPGVLRPPGPICGIEFNRGWQLGVLKKVDRRPLAQGITADRPERVGVGPVLRDGNQVDREDGLVNYRLTWTLQLNGFLFAALALIGSEMDDRLEALLLTTLPIAGMAVSVAYWGR